MGQLIRTRQILFDSQIDFTSLLKITNLANGTAANDAVNLSQLEAVAAGYDPKASVRVATNQTLNLTVDYTRTGTGSTHILTALVDGILSIDGVSTGWNDIDNDGATNSPEDPTQATRVLIKTASDAADNGIYVVKDKGTADTPWKLQRAADQDGTPASEVSTGNTTFVTEGNVNQGTAFVVINDGANTGQLTVDTDNLNWTEVGATTTFTAGNGIDATSLSGGTIALNLDGISNGTSGLKLTTDGVKISDNLGGTGLAQASGVLSVDLNGLSAAVVDVAADSFAFVDATDHGSKLESFADLATAFAGNGLVATSGVLAVDITEFTADTLVGATDILHIHDGAAKKITFANFESSLSLENIQTGTAAGQLMIWDNTTGLWDNAMLTAATGDRAGVSIVNTDGAITLGVNIEDGTTLSNTVSDADAVLLYNADVDANEKAVMTDLVTYFNSALSFDNYTSWTLSDGTNTQNIASGNSAIFAHGSGLQIVVGATDTAIFTIVPDTTGGANLATVVDLNANGVGIRVDDITIEDDGNGATGRLRIKASGINESHLSTTNAPTDNQILSYDSATGGFTWVNDAGNVTSPVRTRNTSATVASGTGIAVTDVFGANDPDTNTIPSVYVNGVFVHVSEDTSGDCWFAEGASGNPVAFASLSGNEDLIWSVTNAGYGLDTSDDIEVRFEA